MAILWRMPMRNAFWIYQPVRSTIRTPFERGQMDFGTSSQAILPAISRKFKMIQTVPFNEAEVGHSGALVRIFQPEAFGHTGCAIAMTLTSCRMDRL